MAHNLVLPRTPLLGRSEALAQVQHLVLQEDAGLITLTGPGGIGKTRLALQAAANLLDHFADGVYFVALAAIVDPILVLEAVAQTVGLRVGAGQPLPVALADHLRQQQLLLVLDNFEQVLPAAPAVADLLHACPQLKVLVTSRVLLHLYGEHTFPVPPLALPHAEEVDRIVARPSPGDAVADLRRYAAVDLFCRRAAAVQPSFTLTPANAVPVAQICIGLDGLPLAIELAAARLKLFGPATLATRLHERLALLTGGPQDLPARQRTLRDEIAWSYNLLQPEEQQLFRHLAVFAGGFSLEAAQNVAACGRSGVSVLDSLTTLVDQNLLRILEQPHGEPRLGMLATIREYAREQLDANGEGEPVRRRHAEYFLAVAETADVELLASQAAPLRRLIAEQENIRAALTWSLHEFRCAPGADPPPAELGLRLVGSLWNYWLMHGDWSEGRRWIEATLRATSRTEASAEARMRALMGSGALALLQADYGVARTHLQECVVLASASGDGRVAVEAAVGLGLIAIELHELAQAQTWLEQALAQARQIGFTFGTAGAFIHLGSVMCERRAYAQAQAFYEEGLAHYEELQAEWDIADAIHYLAQAARLQGDTVRAAALFADSLARWRNLGITQWGWIVECLAGVAAIYSPAQPVAAARLFGAAAALQARIGVPAPVLVRSDVRAELAAVQKGLGEDGFAQAWTAGQALAPEQAIAMAIALAASPANSLLPAPSVRVSLPTGSHASGREGGLTPREAEVLRLLAEGLTYVEIADRLVITRRTVNAHVDSIYSKLGVNNRMAAARVAAAHKLI